ncbi:uncharacterized protein LOC128891504 isoform X1 [Hylaeus anthracinus]|uniref:uncharacterized protein LOC128891504 isoform X1 n=1 Tax=Hylaeus anthracinus TaxID=313031 RepID=UPI0023B97A2B|nr:uncharacterized protein LOC128891504 isoform X1 [Hylaeus anthracinus]
MESVVPLRFDNLELKKWLHFVGPPRRYGVLQKLRKDLQNFGLSRRQVHQALVQLATKPRVILKRQPTSRRYGPRNLSLENTKGIDDEEEDIRNEKAEDLKAFKGEPPDGPQESLVSSNKYKSGSNTLTTFHSFDKALQQLNQIYFVKMTTRENSMKKGGCTVVTADTTFKSRGRDCTKDGNLPLKKRSMCNQDEVQVTLVDGIRSPQRTPDLLSDKVGGVINHESSKRHRMKLDLHFPKRTNNVSKSNTTTFRDTKAEYKNENIHKTKSNEAITSDASHKRKKISASIDEMKEIDKKKKKHLKDKFRIYFGNFTSVSEDEQEKDILQKRFKKRRKKDSVDSCDSGLCISDGNVASNCVEVLKDIQRAVPDSTMQDEFNEDTSKKMSIKSEITNKPQVHRDKSIIISNEIKRSKSQDSTCKTCNMEKTRERTLEEKLISIFGTSDVVQMTTPTDATSKTCNADRDVRLDIIEDTSKTVPTADVTRSVQTSEELEVNDPVGITRIDTNTTPCVTPETCNTNCNAELEVTKSVSEIITTDVTRTVPTIEGSQANVPVEKTETDTNTTLCVTPKTCNANCDAQVDISRDTRKSQGNDLDIRIFNESMQLFSSESCLTASDLKVLTGTVPNYNKDDKDKGGTCAVTCAIAGTDVETVSISNDICNASYDITKTVLQEFGPNHATEQMDVQSNQIPHPRLRVRSSAELGSRWCPTPVHSIEPTVLNSSYTNTITQSDAASIPLPSATFQKQPIPAQSVPVFVNFTAPSSLVYEEAPPSRRTEQTNVECQEAIRKILLTIYTIIQYLRTSNHATNSDYDMLLYKEFEQLKNVVKTDNFKRLVSGVLNGLNKKMIKMPLLTLQELFMYAPSLLPLYVESLDKESQLLKNNPNIHLNVTPSAFTKRTLNENSYQNTETLQNPYATLAQTKPQNSIPITTIQTQNSTSLNQTAYSNINSPMHMHHKYKLSTQRPALQQKHHTYLGRQNPVMNVHAMQGNLLQQSSHSSINVNQPGKHTFVPVTNTSYLHHQCHVPQDAYASSGNRVYGVNTSVPNHMIRQNSNPAHAIQHENTIPTYMSQNQNINPVYMNQLQNNQAHIIQEQNFNSAQIEQQQNIKGIRKNQQQNRQAYPTTVQQQNVNSVHANQQQNINPVHANQQQNINQAQAIQQKNITSTNQHFQNTIHTQSNFDTLRGILQSHDRPQLFQNKQQNVPVMNNIPQTVEELTKKSQNSGLEQATPPPCIQNNHFSQAKEKPIPTTKRKPVQTSLESTATEFNMLQNFSDIQKIMLFRHVNFYCNSCCTWFEQSYTTSQQWLEIYIERLLLFQFQAVLKRIVDKTLNYHIKNLSHDKCKTNTSKNNVLENTNIDVPKEVQIRLQENEVNGSVCNSEAKQQCNTTDAVQCNTVLREKIESRISQEENVQKTERDEQTTLQDTENHTNVIKEDFGSSIQKQSSDESAKINENISDTTQNELLPAPMLEARSKDIAQQSNSHLVIVEISPDNDQVRVVDTNVIGEIKDGVIEINESKDTVIKVDETKDGVIEMNESKDTVIKVDETKDDVIEMNESKDTVIKVSETKDGVIEMNEIKDVDETKDNVIKIESMESVKQEHNLKEQELCSTTGLFIATESSDNDIKYINDIDINEVATEDSITSCIVVDVRSITLETFEEMGEGSYISATNIEGNIEEEEIKICLFCSKPSTVVCKRCLEAKYCSKECAKLHWQHHYQNCKPIEKSIYL